MTVELVADGFGFLEGPVWLDSGALLVVDVSSGDLVRVDVITGERSVVAHCGGGPNGVAVGPDGRIYVCNNGGLVFDRAGGLLVPGLVADDAPAGSIQVVDPATGSVETLYDSCDGRPLLAPNDVVFDGHGGFWFTDCGHVRDRSIDRGSIYYAAADGSSIVEAAFGLLQPNGIGLSPAGDLLYVAETMPGRVWSWAVEAPGILRQTGTGPAGGDLLYGFDGAQMLDSLAIDADGNVWVATLRTGAVSVITPGGSLTGQIVVPLADPFVTNVCFGGDDGRDAFITSGGRGRIYRTRSAVRGLALAHTLLDTLTRPLDGVGVM